MGVVWGVGMVDVVCIVEVVDLVWLAVVVVEFCYVYVFDIECYCVYCENVS